MSAESKPRNGRRLQFPIQNGIRCVADAILRGYAEEDIIKKYSPKPKHYNSLFDYCREIADQLPQRQAFYTIDFEDVLWKLQEWKKCLPKVEIFYAVNANSNPILLELVKHLGLSFSCVSQGEMKMVLDTGASPKDIIFAHTIKAVEELKFASEKRVELMAFDNEDELLKIHRVYPDAKLLIRIVPAKINSFDDLSEKFGCTEGDAVKLLNLAHKLGLNVLGISFHIGTLCSDLTSYTSTIETSRRLFDAAKDIGFSFSILDIGGILFGSSEMHNNFYTIADTINKSLEEHFPGNQVKIIAEPGAYIVCSAFSLVCTVLGRRCIDNEAEDKSKRYYYLNGGMFSSFFNGSHSCVVEPTPVLDELEIQSRPKHESRLYGQTSHPDDIIMHSTVLPELKVGEQILLFPMGVYCFGVNSTFCGLQLPVPRYAFIHKERLNMDWIKAKKNISNFLKKYVTFIGCTESDI